MRTQITGETPVIDEVNIISHEDMERHNDLEQQFLEWMNNVNPAELNEEVDKALLLVEEIVQYSTVLATHADENNQTSLMIAVERGLTERLLESENGKRIFDFLAGDVANINCQDAYRDTALFKAASHDYLKTVEALFAKGAGLDIPCHQGDTALIIAAEENSVKVLKFLIEKGANLDAREEVIQDTALMRAAAKGNKEAADLLINAVANVDERNAIGGTALIAAATISGNCKIVGMLLNKGANVNVRDKKGLTALTGSIQHDHEDVASLLIEKGAKLSVADLDHAEKLHNGEMFSRMVVAILNQEGIDESVKASLREKLQGNAHFLNAESSRVASQHNLLEQQLSPVVTAVSNVSQMSGKSNKQKS